MPEIPLNIIEFIEHPDFLNDRSLSPMQRVILKVNLRASSGRE